MNGLVLLNTILCQDELFIKFLKNIIYFNTIKVIILFDILYKNSDRWI